MARKPASAAPERAIAQRVSQLEAAMESMIERIGERIELAMTRALTEYTHRDDYIKLAAEVATLRTWKDELAGARAVETKVADTAKENLQEWARTLTPYFFGVLGFVYLAMKAVGS